MKRKDARGNFLEALEELEKEKGIKKDELIEAIELALLLLIKNYGEEQNVEVSIDKSSGDVQVFKTKTIVEDEDLVDASNEITYSEALNIKKKLKLEQKLSMKWTVKILEEMQFKNAKQIVIQRVREAERENIYENSKLKNVTS